MKGIKLESQVIEADKETAYESILGFDSRTQNYKIEYRTWTVNEIVR